MFRILSQLKKTFLPKDRKVSETVLVSKRNSTTVGLYYPSTNIVMIRNPDENGDAVVFRFDYVGGPLRLVTGKWSKDFPQSMVFFDINSSIFLFRHQPLDGGPDVLIPFGDPSEYSVPLAGDWDGDGVAGIGLFNSKNRTFHLKNGLGPGNSDYIFAFGRANDGLIPISGDWTGDGKDTVGLYDPVNAEFMLKNSLAGGVADIKFKIKNPPSLSLPLTGDWLGNGRTSVGIYDLSAGIFTLINDLLTPEITTEITFGPSGQMCIPFSVSWIPKN